MSDIGRQATLAFVAETKLLVYNAFLWPMFPALIRVKRRVASGMLGLKVMVGGARQEENNNAPPPVASLGGAPAVCFSWWRNSDILVRLCTLWVMVGTGLHPTVLLFADQRRGRKQEVAGWWHQTCRRITAEQFTVFVNVALFLRLLLDCSVLVPALPPASDDVVAQMIWWPTSLASFRHFVICHKYCNV